MFKRQRNVFCSFIRYGVIAILVLLVILIVAFHLEFPGTPKRFHQNTREFDALKFLKNNPVDRNVEENTTKDCETVHVGFVCAGNRNNIFIHTLIKSILFYRKNPIHLHILTNGVSDKVLRTLFNTWNVPKVNATFYDLDNYLTEVRWIPNSHYSGIYGLMKLVFPKVVPIEVTNRIIVLDTDLTFTCDIKELWDLFQLFNNKQAIGIVENQSDYYLGKTSKITPWPALKRGYNSGVLLFDLIKLKHMKWSQLWNIVAKQTAIEYGSTRLGDQDIFNAVFYQKPEILYELPCSWNIQLSDNTDSYLCYAKEPVKIAHWNSPKKINVINKDGAYFQNLYHTFSELNGNLLRLPLNICNGFEETVSMASDDVCFEFHKSQSAKWRTLLFFREYKNFFIDNDVTFVAQLSFDRLQLIQDLAEFWKGPISLSIYVSDTELQQTNNFIENSDVLVDRTNIAYHAVFKDGEYYPVNILRNIALRNVDTPYVFLADIDFLPSKGLYQQLRTHITSLKNLNKKALVVPAFQLQRYKSRIPLNKEELMTMSSTKKVSPFLMDIWPGGHAATNYVHWYKAHALYAVTWTPNYEPYIVVHRNVTQYDERFLGFGWNKVSHIMELDAQGYEFMVVPDGFIVHKPHGPSQDIDKFRKNPVYRRCLHNLKNEFIQGLYTKYGKHYEKEMLPDTDVTLEAMNEGIDNDGVNNKRILSKDRRLRSVNKPTTDYFYIDNHFTRAAT